MRNLMAMIDFNDVLAAIGLGLLGAGLAMWSVPLAMVVVGGVLLAAGVSGALRKGGVR